MAAIDSDLLIAEMEKRHAEGDEITVGYVKHMTPLDVIPIPKGATNGDIIKAIFPNVRTFESGLEHLSVEVRIGEYPSPLTMNVSGDWWNAPYKIESKVE